jgi:hypothetical protein
VLLVLAVSFLLGLILTSRVGSQSSQWIEQTILFRIPGYAAVKNIVYGFADGKVNPSLTVASLERLKSSRPVDAGGRILIKQAGREKFFILRQVNKNRRRNIHEQCKENRAVVVNLGTLVQWARLPASHLIKDGKPCFVELVTNNN